MRGLTGVPVYRDRLGRRPEKIPYGNDPTRWIPELSAILVQTEGLLSSQVIEPLGGARPEGHLRALRGPQPHVDLSDPRYAMPLDFWWYPGAQPQAARACLLALAILALAVAAGARLYVLSFGRRRPWCGPPAPAR